MAIMALAGAGKGLCVLLLAITQQRGRVVVLVAQMAHTSQGSSAIGTIRISARTDLEKTDIKINQV